MLVIQKANIFTRSMEKSKMTMTKNEVENLARSLMDAHGLTNWSFEWNRGQHLFGLCQHRTKTILMSVFIPPINSDHAIEQILLHEIAHGLVGKKHDHDALWESIARSIGYKGGRLFLQREGFVSPPMKYVAKCKICGWEHGRTRPVKKGWKYSCGSCSKGYNPKYPIKYVLNPKFKERREVK